MKWKFIQDISSIEAWKLFICILDGRIKILKII